MYTVTWCHESIFQLIKLQILDSEVIINSNLYYDEYYTIYNQSTCMITCLSIRANQWNT